jgi:hypothetical protein
MASLRRDEWEAPVEARRQHALEAEWALAVARAQLRFLQNRMM